MSAYEGSYQQQMRECPYHATNWDKDCILCDDRQQWIKKMSQPASPSFASAAEPLMSQNEYDSRIIAAYKERLRKEIRSELVEVNKLLQDYRDNNEITGAVDVAGNRDGLMKALTLIDQTT